MRSANNVDTCVLSMTCLGILIAMYPDVNVPPMKTEYPEDNFHRSSKKRKNDEICGFANRIG